MKFQPHSYQVRMVDHVLKYKRCALFAEMGLGKTTIVASALRMCLKIESEIKRILVIAPLKVASITWPAELQKWDHLQKLTYAVACGTPKQRMAAIQGRAQFVFMNYENIQWFCEIYKGHENLIPFDVIVFDESSRMKGYRTKRFKSIQKIMARFRRVILLSGTPSPQGISDLWSQIWLLDNGKRLGGNITTFRNRWFYASPRPWGTEWMLKDHAEKEVRERISDICVSLKTEDYLELPEIIHNTVPVYLPATARTQYDELEREMYLEVGNGEVEVYNAAAKTGKCLQMANGAVYIDEEHNWEGIHDAKIQALESVIEEAVGTPVLVAYNFRSDLQRLRNKFRNARVLDKSQKTIEEWNNGKIPILLGHPASVGHGLNLQEGSNIAVWFGLTWSLENYLQFNARLHRQGQTKPVFIHHLVAVNTVDEQVMKALKEKRTAQDVLMEAVKMRKGA